MTPCEGYLNMKAGPKAVGFQYSVVQNSTFTHTHVVYMTVFPREGKRTLELPNVVHDLLVTGTK